MSYASEVLADSPVLFWRCQEASGLPQDSSSGGAQDADGSTGTAVYQQSSPITSDPSDFSIRFDADPTFFTVSDRAALDLGDTFTLEAWVRRQTTGVFEQIMDKGSGPFGLAFNTSNFVLLSSGGAGDICRSATAITSTTNWYHVVATKNGADTGKIYINGVDDTVPIVDFTCTNNATALHIGDTAFTGAPINAFMDEIAIYSTALSQARVQAHYSAAITTGVALRSQHLDYDYSR